MRKGKGHPLKIMQENENYEVPDCVIDVLEEFASQCMNKKIEHKKPPNHHQLPIPKMYSAVHSKEWSSEH